jgi:hypothetical protein
VADDLLVRALRELGRTLDTGPVPDVAPAVLARVAGTVPRAPLLGRVGRRLRILLGAALVAVLAAVPAVREAAADVAGAMLRLPGVVVRAGEAPRPVPSASPAPAVAGRLGVELGYSRPPVTLAEARQRAAPVLRLPAGLGPPDEVYLHGPGGRVVSMLWAARPGLPALPGSRIGLLVDTITPSDGPLFEKYVGSFPAEQVTVAGRPAVWIGGPHELVPIGEDGWPRYDLGRGARGTLVVPLPGGTVRLESGLDRAAALRLAAGLR